MFDSIGSWCKSVGLRISGIFGRSAEKNRETEEAVRAMIDAGLKAKTKAYQDLGKEVAVVMARRTTNMKQLAETDARLQAQWRKSRHAKVVVEREAKRLLSDGMTIEDAKVAIPTSENALVRESYALFGRLRGNISRDVELKATYETNIAELTKQIEDFRTQGQQLHAELMDMKLKRDILLARFVSARARKQASDVKAGIGTDGSAEIFASVEEIVAKAEAAAEVSETMTGMDSERAMKRFDLAVEEAEAHEALFRDLPKGDPAASHVLPPDTEGGKIFDEMQSLEASGVR